MAQHLVCSADACWQSAQSPVGSQYNARKELEVLVVWGGCALCHPRMALLSPQLLRCQAWCTDASCMDTSWACRHGRHSWTWLVSGPLR
jgi:hypothetical protein